MCILSLMLDIFSHPYQLDESISNFRVVGWYFSFLFNFCLQTVENLIRRCALRRLIRFCTVCQCPTKKTLGLYGLRGYYYKVPLLLDTQPWSKTEKSPSQNTPKVGCGDLDHLRELRWLECMTCVPLGL